MKVLDYARAHWRGLLLAASVLLAFAGGYVSGARGGRGQFSDVVSGTSTVQTVTVEHTVVVEKPVDRWRTRVVEVTKYDPQGKKTETIVAKTDSGEHQEGSVKIDETNLRVDSKTTEREAISRVVPRLRATVELQPGLVDFHRPTVNAAVGATYDLVQLGPFALYAGGQVRAPIAGPGGSVEVLGVLGLSVAH